MDDRGAARPTRGPWAGSSSPREVAAEEFPTFLADAVVLARVFAAGDIGGDCGERQRARFRR
eukprot:433948-Lingulodinium_polyedra.AAC.1